jgi:hypothetical protein
VCASARWTQRAARASGAEEDWEPTGRRDERREDEGTRAREDDRRGGSTRQASWMKAIALQQASQRKAQAQANHLRSHRLDEWKPHGAPTKAVQMRCTRYSASCVDLFPSVSSPSPPALFSCALGLRCSLASGTDSARSAGSVQTRSGHSPPVSSTALPACGLLGSGRRPHRVLPAAVRSGGTRSLARHWCAHGRERATARRTRASWDADASYVPIAVTSRLDLAP